MLYQNKTVYFLYDVLIIKLYLLCCSACKIRVSYPQNSFVWNKRTFQTSSKCIEGQRRSRSKSLNSAEFIFGTSAVFRVLHPPLFFLPRNEPWFLFLFFFTNSRAQLVYFSNTPKYFFNSMSFVLPNSKLKITAEGETWALQKRVKD